jgi:hypothetical protein
MAALAMLLGLAFIPGGTQSKVEAAAPDGEQLGQVA